MGAMQKIALREDTGMEPAESGMPSYDYATFPRQFLSYRWFKPIFVFALAFVFMFVFQTLALILATMWAGDINFVLSLSVDYDDMNPYTGPGALFEIGGVAVLLPALALAALIVRDRPYSSYSSSRGGWNWKAFALCLVVAVAVYALDAIIESVFFPGEPGDGVMRFTVEGVLLCLVLIPLQCAAEEYVFRGFFLQTFASWTKLPIVGIILSAAVFAAMHPYNLIGVATIFIGGVVWGVIAWQSKGLEATCAIHIVNNMLAFTFGGFGWQTVTSEVDIASLIAAAVIDVVYAVAVLLLGKKFGWFASKGDGVTKYNDKQRAVIASKQARKGRSATAPPEPPVYRDTGLR